MNLYIPWLKKKARNNPEKENANEARRLFLEAGLLLKQRREEYQLSRSDLAQKTRITTPVLEAIENGLSNKLPEAAYLYSMLDILEDELNLGRGRLNGILQGKKKYSKKKVFNTLTPGNIDIFRTWQGSILYLIIILSCIFGLNYQQRYLSITNSQVFEPIIPNIEHLSIKNDEDYQMYSSRNTIRSNRENKHSTQNWFNSLLSIFQKKSNLGLLEISLSEKSNLSITSGDGYQADFNNVKGEFTLKLLSPVLVKIQPPPTINDQVIWEDKSYFPDNISNGTYKFN